MMDELLADFIAETREMLEALGGEIVAWEADPNDRARLDTIFRFVHTVKGNCGFFTFPRLERLSHSAEDALADCRAGRREADQRLVSAVLAIIDRIGELTDSIEAGEDIGEDGDESLIAALGEAEDGPAEQEPEATAPLEGDNSDSQPSAARQASVQRSIRLPVSLLDEVMKGVSDLVLARNELARRLRETQAQAELGQPFDRLTGILTDVRDSVTRMRMQRLEHLFGSFPRLVRDLANDLGKQVMIDFSGGDVELDREMIEIIRDPLTHIIRNAVDHGIETPGERIASGKREIGLLSFDARQAGNQITLAISDNGRGIPADRLAAKAVASGTHSKAEIEAMSEREKLDLIFHPGLSTADEVSTISGRGVGMDVVRNNIEKVGGSIELASTPGEGTTFRLKLPLTLSIISAITVASGDQRYAIPRSLIEEISFGTASALEFVEAGEQCLVTFRGRRIPCLSLTEILGQETSGTIDWEDATLILLRPAAADDFFALAVDHVLDHEDIVIKPIAPAVMRTGIYCGTTLLEDGRPMMLIDIPSIAAARGLVGQNRRTTADDQDEAVETDAAIPAMMFTAIDGRRRAIRLELVRRIDTVDRSQIDLEEASAQVVIDGKLIPLAGHEGGELSSGRCRLLRVTDGEREIAYAVAEVLDAVDITGPLAPAPDDESLEGMALVDGRPLPLIDAHRLFARARMGPDIASGLACRIPSGDPWSRKILAPLLENAGHRIVEEDDGDADVAFALAGDETGARAAGAPVITLRSTPESDGSPSIYRYDREGLLGALSQMAQGGSR